MFLFYCSENIIEYLNDLQKCNSYYGGWNNNSIHKLYAEYLTDNSLMLREILQRYLLIVNINICLKRRNNGDDIVRRNQIVWES